MESIKNYVYGSRVASEENIMNCIYDSGVASDGKHYELCI